MTEEQLAQMERDRPVLVGMLTMTLGDLYAEVRRSWQQIDTLHEALETALRLLQQTCPSATQIAAIGFVLAESKAANAARREG